MKIAILAPGGVGRDGVSEVIPCFLWLIERLVRAGDEVHVFTLRQEPQPGRWQLLGAQVHNAGRRPRRLRMFRAILAEHRRGRFDVLHAMWAVPAGLVAAAAGRILRLPILLCLPGGDLVSLPRLFYGGRLTLRGRAQLRLALAAADRIVAPSAFMVEQAAAAGAAASRLPFGVALDRWPPRPPRRRIAGAPAKLLHVASLNRVKDQETLLQAAAALKAGSLSFTLDIIGFDTLDGAVQRRSHELALDDCVRFHGFLPHHELRPWIERADLLVMASRHEAGPLVALEAAVAGIPTAGTAVGHLADWAGEAAVAVPVGDAAALARAVSELLADEDRRLAIAAEAQRRALAEDADFTAAETRRIYSELAARRRGS